MAYRTYDRVKETSTTTGTGTYTLAGAASGFRAFSAVMTNGDYCTYVAEDGTNWEVCHGVWSTGGTLSRARVLASSNSGSAVSWAAGSRSLYMAAAAADRNPRTRAQTSDHAISTIAATVVPDLTLDNVQPGVYTFKYSLMVQSATATVSPMYGVNFTNSTSFFKVSMWVVDTGGLATGTGTADDVGTSAGGMLTGTTQSNTATTAPNLGHTGGVGTINSNILVIFEGLVRVTAAGSLEFWHGSETATSTTVKAGSCVVLTRMDDY